MIKPGEQPCKFTTKRAPRRRNSSGKLPNTKRDDETAQDQKEEAEEEAIDIHLNTTNDENGATKKEEPTAGLYGEWQTMPYPRPTATDVRSASHHKYLRYISC